MTPPDPADHDRVSALQPPPTDHRPGVAGNERLTALAGAILLPLIAAEIATIANVRALMSTHVVAGALLAGPLTVKTTSTGWRFIRYYTHHPAYRRKGPPRPLQRTTAPLLLVATLVLIGSGIGLATTRPGTLSPLYITHKVSFLAWTVLLGIHLLAYIWRVPRLVTSDWRRYRPQDAPGRRYRLAVNLAALAAAGLAAILILPCGARKVGSAMLPANIR
jgi:hypothetical protein